MKKIITIIFCLFISATMMGQESIVFMGAPTKGNAHMIISKLNKKGFRTIRTGKKDYCDGGDIILEGMFCGELCDINMYRDEDWNVTDFWITTHEHNKISKERAKKMSKTFFTEYYECKKNPSLHFPRLCHGDTSNPVKLTILDKAGEPIGVVTFQCMLSQVHIKFQNIEKKKKTFHKCDEHCDGYWHEEGVGLHDYLFAR